MAGDGGRVREMAGDDLLVVGVGEHEDGRRLVERQPAKRYAVRREAHVVLEGRVDEAIALVDAVIGGRVDEGVAILG